MIIKRYILHDLINHLEKPEISLIIGPRQAGKTTIMLELKRLLDEKERKTLFLSLDNEADKVHFSFQSNLIEKIETEIGKVKGFVFLDEVQRKENAGIFFKGIYDMNLPYKFIMSGSGSMELKEKIHESLAGRKRVFEITTLNFEEFTNFKTKYKYEDRIEKYLNIEKVKEESLLKEYLNFGGYPKVVLEETLKEKQRVINEIYQSYLEKDISYLLGIKKTSDFSNLVKIFSSQVGNLINFSEISNTLGINIKTVKNYIYYLEKTFIIKRITPFFRNVRSEISKTPIFYFTDLGLRNFVAQTFGNIDVNSQAGFIFQNFIFNILSEFSGETFTPLYFWRTKHGSEVDFVLEKTFNPFPIEVKYKNLKKPEISRSLRSFVEKYKPEKAVIVNLSLETKTNINTTEVCFLPYFKLRSLLFKSFA